MDDQHWKQTILIMLFMVIIYACSGVVIAQLQDKINILTEEIRNQKPIICIGRDMGVLEYISVIEEGDIE